ncbi:MAG: NUDIX domain-containing protein [Crocinitomicaceae bacterium]|nr:NUDIX domain-containing protein [Crocinitomicaceae bacterium]
MSRYNLRVYGLLKDENQVLITHEHRGGMIMTKFPGGGLEMGEGLADCLIREFKEELAIEIEVNDLFYVNDFMQISEFNKSDQLISFYYFVSTQDLDDIPVNPLVEGKLKRGQQIFEWKDIQKLKEDDLSFPLDKIVLEKLKKN